MTQTRTRISLADWDAATTAQRAEWLRMACYLSMEDAAILKTREEEARTSHNHPVPCPDAQGPGDAFDNQTPAPETRQTVAEYECWTCIPGAALRGYDGEWLADCRAAGHDVRKMSRTPVVVAECWTCGKPHRICTDRSLKQCRDLGHDVREVKPEVSR